MQGVLAAEVAHHGVPRPMTRSPASWCGLAPLGPLPTMAKFTLPVPGGQQAGADGLGHLDLAAPTEWDLPRLEHGRHPVGGLGGVPQSRDLVGVLHGAQR